MYSFGNFDLLYLMGILQIAVPFAVFIHTVGGTYFI